MEIDKTRGARLRTIALHEGITQTKLSEMIDCSPVHLSKIINGSRNLTEEMAQKVVSLFPEYRLPWLLGYDDYMTEEDALRGPLKRIAQRMVGWKVAVEYTLQSMGYTVRLNGADYLDTVDDILGVWRTFHTPLLTKTTRSALNAARKRTMRCCKKSEISRSS